jgi:energy-coupling factor transporter transmembrane protein EcfT
MLIYLSSIFSIIRKVFWMILLSIFILSVILFFATSFEIIFLIIVVFIGIPLIVLKKFFHVMVSCPAKYDDHYLYIGKNKIKFQDIKAVKLVARNLYKIKIEGDTKNYYFESYNWGLHEYVTYFSYTFNKKTQELVRRINVAKENN